MSESVNRAAAVVDRVTARDEHDGIKTEVDVELRSDGTIFVSDIRQWQHELDAEPAGRAALRSDGGKDGG